jgi:hypothetical protein
LYNGVELNAGGSPVGEFCTARTVGNYGLSAFTVKGSSAMDCGSTAVYGVNVSDCRGESTGVDAGIIGSTVQNCFGSSSSGIGLTAFTALNYYGTSSSNIGLSAKNAQNCQGNRSGAAPGIFAETASNCYGESPNRGISANVAIACSGRSLGKSYGVFATSIANTCYGISATGTGLGTYIAIGCVGANNFGPSLLASFKYNMPP